MPNLSIEIEIRPREGYHVREQEYVGKIPLPKCLVPVLKRLGVGKQEDIASLETDKEK